MAQSRKMLFTSFEEIKKDQFYFYLERFLHLSIYGKNSALKLSDAVHAKAHFVDIRFIKIRSIWNLVKESRQVYPTEETTFHLVHNKNLNIQVTFLYLQQSLNRD